MPGPEYNGVAALRARFEQQATDKANADRRTLPPRAVEPKFQPARNIEAKNTLTAQQLAFPVAKTVVSEPRPAPRPQSRALVNGGRPVQLEPLQVQASAHGSTQAITLPEIQSPGKVSALVASFAAKNGSQSSLHKYSKPPLNNSIKNLSIVSKPGFHQPPSIQQIQRPIGIARRINPEMEHAMIRGLGQTRDLYQGKTTLKRILGDGTSPTGGAASPTKTSNSHLPTTDLPH